MKTEHSRLTINEEPWSDPLERSCDLCSKVQEEVFAYAENTFGSYKLRAGWVCFECWPTEGAWHKAILRERAVHVGGNMFSTDHIPRGEER